MLERYVKLYDCMWRTAEDMAHCGRPGRILEVDAHWPTELMCIYKAEVGMGLIRMSGLMRGAASHALTRSGQRGAHKATDSHTGVPGQLTA